MERGRLLHLLYSGRNESWVCEEDGFKHLDFPWTFRGTQTQTLPSPDIMNEVENIPHISDWNTAADEYSMLNCYVFLIYFNSYSLNIIYMCLSFIKQILYALLILFFSKKY